MSPPAVDAAGRGSSPAAGPIADWLLRINVLVASRMTHRRRYCSPRLKVATSTYKAPIGTCLFENRRGTSISLEDIDSLETPAWTSLITKLRRPFRSAHDCSNRGTERLRWSARDECSCRPILSTRRRRRGRAQVAPRQSRERRRLGSAGGRGAHVAGVVLTGTAKPRLGEPDPRKALASVVDASRDSYAALSCMLDRPAGYLRRFVINAGQAPCGRTSIPGSRITSD
jgi:hypothetical protein